MSKQKKTSIGGMALMEGIMMRGPQKTMMAVRRPDGEIEVSEESFKSLASKSKFFKIPLVRGVVGFIDSMLTGYKCLIKSAEIAGLELEEEEASEFDKKLMNFFGDKLMTVISAIAMVFGVALAVGLFFLLPSFLFDQLQKLWPGILGLRSPFEGGLRILIFVVYILAISGMKDVKKMFQYHGAEHKTIFCYEAGLELTVENVKKQRRFHPRCGTSFLLIMMVLGIIIGFFIPFQDMYLRSAVKILLVPLMMGLGYEIIKIAGRHDNILTRIVSAPGIWMQRLTTKEPDDDQIEVAIAALAPVIPENGEDEWGS